MHPQLWYARYLVEAHQSEMLENNIHGNLPTYPNSGKTFGYLNSIAKLDEKGTLLQPNRDLRAEVGEIAQKELDLDVLDLPSFPNDSPLMDEQSSWYNETVADWYERGMPPREIYRRVEEPDEDLYLEKLDKDWSEMDMLIGDPVHSFLDRVNVNRHVAFDDVDLYESFVTKYEFGNEQQAKEIREYIEFHSSELESLQLKNGIDDERLPISVAMLMNASDQMKEMLHKFTEDNPSWEAITDTDHVTAGTSRFIHVLTAKASWQQRVEWTETDPCISEGIKVMGVFVQADDAVLIGQLPKNLRQAETVLILGATPVYPVLRQFFRDLKLPAATVDPLPREAKEAYFEEYLNMRIFQTTDFLRPASGNNSVPYSRLLDLIYAYIERENSYPFIISSKKFLDENAPKLEREFDWFTREKYSIHFAKAIGTNKFEDIRDCIVYGCPHYGDDYVRQMSAYCGDIDAEPIRKKNQPTEWSTEVSQEIYDNMTAGTVFQALMRVGRSTSDRTTVWVESSAIPRYVPRYKMDVHALTQTESEMLELLSEERLTIPEAYEKIDASWTTAYDAMKNLKDFGLVEVDGSASYDADIWNVLIDISGKEDLPQAIARLVNSIYIQADNSLDYIEAEIEDPDPVLQTAEGREPPKVDKDAVKTKIREKEGQPIWSYVEHADEYGEVIPGAEVERVRPSTEQTTLGDD